MKFLFIVQGEGRGHLTQAITLEEILRRNGHEVVEVLVGKSSSRRLPGFFNRNIHAPVKRFVSLFLIWKMTCGWKTHGKQIVALIAWLKL